MSGFCREIVTLQLGHYSNFVGTHWWNLQDASLSYDSDPQQGEVHSDVSFREGQTLGGQLTYTPRLIALDLKEGCLYAPEKESSNISWEGDITMHQETPALKNPFLQDLDTLETGAVLAQDDFVSTYQPHCSAAAVMGGSSVNQQLERVGRSYALEGSVRVWSDFLRLHLHPRTVSVIHQYNHDGGQYSPAQLELASGGYREDLEDRLHFFTEECDHLQGFQVLCDMTNGFSGLGSKVTELLHDSYSGKGILTWGMAPVTHPNATPMQDLYHVINTALGIVHMANHSSFFCPLTLRGGLGRRPGAPLRPGAGAGRPHHALPPAREQRPLVADGGPADRLREEAVWALTHGPLCTACAVGRTCWPPTSPPSTPPAPCRCHGHTHAHAHAHTHTRTRAHTHSFLLTSPPLGTTQGHEPAVRAQQADRPLPPDLQPRPGHPGLAAEPGPAPRLFLSQGPEMAEYQEALEELRLLARCYRDDSRRGGAHFSSSGEDEDSDD
ncbi:hypothetical protein CRUP_019083 [Coryphaenoides rupestris]|nr:hypothetical protein CRUP_019083 [Coryphaenoides rupestris]